MNPFEAELFEEDEVDIAPSGRGINPRNLKRLVYPKKARAFVGDPFSLPPGSDLIFDVECFWNYFEVGFKHPDTQQYFYVEMRRGGEFPAGVRRILWHFRLISFNGIQYDMPMLEAALRGFTTDELKELSDKIIKFGERKANPHSPYNHVDLIQVAPLKNSLKGYGAQLHAERLQELWTDHDGDLPEEDIPDVIEYNFNDLDLTELLLNAPKYGMKPHIELRERLGGEIGEDLRSKSDAQVAEAFINARIAELTGHRPRTPEFDEDFEFNYKPPSFLQYQTPMLRDVLDRVQGATFRLNAAGRPIMPRELASLKLRMGVCEYKMGMGGLHSSEKSAAYRADADNALTDTDFESFYPWLIINLELFPQHIGAIFLRVFRDDLVLRRIALKKLKDRLEAGLKIAINGTFGKLGNLYATIFSPHLMIQTTVSGQLVLLMAIELVEQAGFQVLSANTDGFVTRVPRNRKAEFGSLVGRVRDITGISLERTDYAAIYSRDVNNYLAVTFEQATDSAGKGLVDQFGQPIYSDKISGCKSKGTYSEEGSAQKSVLSKNPETLICSDAIKALLSNGTKIEETIRGCRDIRRFVVVRNVKGGAHKDGYYLGKNIRWYYAKGVPGEINYVTNGNKVPNSDGACPLMELGEFPANLDFEYYERKAYGMLREIGYFGGITRQKALF